MSTKNKLKNTMLKKAEGQITKLYDARESYDKEVIEAMSEELESLKKEYEELKLNSNVITSFNKDEYFKKQARLKELPEIINKLEADLIKAHSDKEEFKSGLCKNIYNEIGADIREEYNNNIDVLLTAFDEHLTELISVYKEMEQLTKEYNNTLYDVITTNGIYLSFGHDVKYNKIKASHNLTGNRLDLFYAE